MSDHWLTVKSAGLRGEHRRWLKKLAFRVELEFCKPTFVNIGVYYGASMHCLRAGSPSARLIGVDVRDWGTRAVKELRAEFIWRDSAVAHVGFEGPVHLLFHDGAMDYETNLLDLRGWCPKISVGGYYVANCYTLKPPRWRQRQAVDAWLERDRWEEIEAPMPMGAFKRLK